MTWYATEMPDDALDPDSLVGKILNPEPARPELLAETKEFLEEYADDFKALVAIEKAEIPLWRVMHDAALSEPINREGPDADCACQAAAQIEVLRDWLLPEEPEPSAYDGRPRYEQRHIIWTHNRQLCAALTEQARIARGD